MFSGLIAHLGRVAAVIGDDRARHALASKRPTRSPKASRRKIRSPINGVCLTVAAYDAPTMTFDVVPESDPRAPDSISCARAIR